MTIQPIGTTSMALYITPTDLREHGLTPAQLTLERALELTRSAFTQAGMTLDGAIEIEAYPNSCGVLVFARVKQPEHLWLSFPGLEPLLAAAQALPSPRPNGALFWHQGRYWLSLPGDATREHLFLSEFGTVERHRPQLDAHLAEYARPILLRSALDTLLHHFPVYPLDKRGII